MSDARKDINKSIEKVDSRDVFDKIGDWAAPAGGSIAGAAFPYILMRGRGRKLRKAADEAYNKWTRKALHGFEDEKGLIAAENMAASAEDSARIHAAKRNVLMAAGAAAGGIGANEYRKKK